MINTIINKINCKKIILAHLDTLYDFDTNTRDNGDISLFFIFPILLSIVLIWQDVRINSDAAGILVTIVSIFAGLLFNLLVLLYDSMRKNHDEYDGSISIKIKFLREISINVSYEILVAIVTVGTTLLCLLENKPIQAIMSFFTFYFFQHFTLTLLMILKRTYTLLSKEADVQNNRAARH
jgi:hypothetical protein